MERDLLEPFRKALNKIEIREERGRKSEDFLQTVIYPAIDRGEKLDEERLVKELREHKRRKPGKGDDFEMGTVLDKVLDHISKYPAGILDRIDQLPEEHKENLLKELKALDILGGLDFEYIDRKLQD